MGETLASSTSDRGLVSRIRKETPETKQQENKQPNQKLGYRPEQRVLKRNASE